MTQEQARQIAAQAWHLKSTKGILMDVRLANAFAGILDAETSRLAAENSQLAKELEARTKERDEFKIVLDAWASVFGSSQLSHASAAFEAEKSAREKAEAELKAKSEECETALRWLNKATANGTEGIDWDDVFMARKVIDGKPMEF